MAKSRPLKKKVKADGCSAAWGAMRALMPQFRSICVHYTRLLGHTADEKRGVFAAS